MTRGPSPRPDADESGPDGPERPDPEGRIKTTRPGPLVAFCVVGLFVGWAVRPVGTQLSGAAPTVSWLPATALLFVAVVVGTLAWSTHRTIHRRRLLLDPHQAVNRLVLGKACALVGALMAGGYFGYALSWLGLTDAALARQRAEHSVAAGVAAVLLMVGALLLERACRVRKEDRRG